jgi:hypothetical protein
MTARVRNVLPEISRFASIGVVATAIYLVVSTALISWSDLPPEISSVVAYLCGMAVVVRDRHVEAEHQPADRIEDGEGEEVACSALH